jgi:hypothetical protein
MQPAQLRLGHDVVDLAKRVHLDVKHITYALRFARLVVLLVYLRVPCLQLHVLLLDYHGLLLVELGKLPLIVEADVLVVLDV